MSGIYIAALITTAIVLAFYGSLIRHLKSPADKRLLLLGFLIALPLQPLAFYLVRVPLDRWLVNLLGKDSNLYQILTTLYAPLTEEPAKLLPLLVPAILRVIRRENFARYALAIGLGFGVGEIWFIAERLAGSPVYAPLPFYMFGGFLGERALVCLIHGAFLAVALWRLRSNLFLGLLGAMALHYFGNFPIFLMQKNAFGLGQTAWQVIVSIWLQLYFFGSIALLARFSGAGSIGRFLFGRARCPECGIVYDRPFFGFNMGPKRYERCRGCKRWHWMNYATKVPDEEAEGPRTASVNEFTKDEDSP